MSSYIDPETVVQIGKSATVDCWGEIVAENFGISKVNGMVLVPCTVLEFLLDNIDRKGFPDTPHGHGNEDKLDRILTALEDAIY